MENEGRETLVHITANRTGRPGITQDTGGRGLSQGLVESLVHHQEEFSRALFEVLPPRTSSGTT